jgi:hypothetical protein
MLMNPQESGLEIVPPIIVNEGADVFAYPSVEAVIRHVEVVDIENGVYEFHDSTGRVLEAKVHRGKLSLVPTSKLESNSETLRGYMIGVLRLQGVLQEDLSTKAFSELARLLLESFQKRK